MSSVQGEKIQNEALVSIIIPTYNRPKWLVEAIRSAAHQSYPAIEIIVVDDGSLPCVNWPVLEQFGNVKYVYQENSGMGIARNSGLAISTGEYIQFLDDDDWLSMEAVQLKLAEFSSNPHLDVVYSDLYLTDENGIVTSRYFKHIRRPLPVGDLYPVLVERNFIPIHGLLWKRQVLEKIGGFKNISGHEDWDCLIRASEFCTFGPLDLPLGYYRTHPTSRAHNFEAMYQGKLIAQTDLSQSERFSSLPTAQRVRLLTLFAFQQLAFGDTQQARQFLVVAHQLAPAAFLPILLRQILGWGRPIAQWLVKYRGIIWKKMGR